MKHFVVVAGNIGVGKSTLVAQLSARWGWQPFHEAVLENPYLADFYGDMGRWGFHSQVFFLASRVRTLRRLADHPTSVIQDRSVYEDAEIFARNLHQQGHLSARDFANYRQLYAAITDFLPHPHLVVYLRASVPTLQARIARRGRDYEQNMAAAYLHQLNELYEQWIASFSAAPVLALPADTLDFVAHPGDFEAIAQAIEARLTLRPTHKKA